MSGFQKRTEEKVCNCRNSKCMKLYCECFAAAVQCNKNCRCVDCQNHSALTSQLRKKEQRFKTQRVCMQKNWMHQKILLMLSIWSKMHRVMQMYRVNNQNQAHYHVIHQLKKYNSDTTSKPKLLYPIVLSQNTNHLKTIISQSNPLNMDDLYLQKCVEILVKSANEGDQVILQTFLCLLNQIDKKVFQNNQMQDEEQQYKSQ